MGYSGGGGLAVMVAEELPEGVRLRNVVLAQPALSPDYDLTRALQRIDGKLVHFHSPHDWLILGLGTRVFGTMDRTKTSASGKNGLDLARVVQDPRLRAKIEQVRWNAGMLGTGHWGGHTGILSYGWNKCCVAPYLLSESFGADGRGEANACRAASATDSH